MSRRPLLLIELLDALGGHEPDATLHASALRPLVGQVRSVAVVWNPERAPKERSVPGDRRAAAVAAAIQSHHTERVVIAGGREAAAGAVAALPSGLDVRWWPTAIDAGANGRPPAPVLLRSPAVVDGAQALAHAVIDAASSRERVPLWDGDFVLAAAPLAGAEGRAMIEAFAAVAEERAGLDLVVLADPQPEFEALARELGVGPRVHFAGPSPRGAEPTWLSSASAVLLASQQPVSAGWLLRVLAAGVPLLPFGNGPASTVDAWLDESGAHPAPKRVRHDATASLAAVLERGLPVERALASGRELAARHRLGTWSGRLAGSWAEPGGDAREVA